LYIVFEYLTTGPYENIIRSMVELFAKSNRPNLFFRACRTNSN